MATQGRMISETYVSAGALSRFTFGTVNSSGQVANTGAGAAADVVLQSTSTAAGQAVNGAIIGRVKVTCAGTIAQGASVASNASGLAVAAATGNIILGKALEAGVSGQIITIDFSKGGNAAP